METAYAERYRDLYRRHWWWRAREHLIVSTLRSMAPLQGWPAILDVGCGDGLFFDRLAEFGDVEGVESEASLVDPDGRWASRIRIQPFDETFQPRKQYGLITMLDVVEHLPDAGAALRRAARLLEPGGTLLVTVPAFQALWTSHDDFNHHVQRFTRTSLARLTEQAGLETVATRYFFFWTCPTKLLIRLKERVLRSPSQMARVPGAFVNRAMYSLSRLEEASLGRLPVPFGSSLLFVGRRL
jgi:2-polyprenyl-3-methyl-5-hydroxy-6-metoxy-1,4-benzoquinol methylase